MTDLRKKKEKTDGLNYAQASVSTSEGPESADVSSDASFLFCLLLSGKTQTIKSVRCIAKSDRIIPSIYCFSSFNYISKFQLKILMF